MSVLQAEACLDYLGSGASASARVCITTYKYKQVVEKAAITPGRCAQSVVFVGQRACSILRNQSRRAIERSARVSMMSTLKI